MDGRASGGGGDNGSSPGLDCLFVLLLIPCMLDDDWQRRRKRRKKKLPSFDRCYVLQQLHIIARRFAITRRSVMGLPRVLLVPKPGSLFSCSSVACSSRPISRYKPILYYNYTAQFRRRLVSHQEGSDPSLYFFSLVLPPFLSGTPPLL